MDVKAGHIRLISEVISDSLNMDVAVLMGANVAMDVAKEDFCECTIGNEKMQPVPIAYPLLCTIYVLHGEDGFV